MVDSSQVSEFRADKQSMNACSRPPTVLIMASVFPARLFRRIAIRLRRSAETHFRACALRLTFLLFLPVLCLSVVAVAADPVTSKPADELSLEDLVNIKVTSVSKKETRLEDSPAAVTVVTQDDIRRFGITSIPDALRLVPGMDVAQINSHEWAISARGFNGEKSTPIVIPPARVFP